VGRILMFSLNEKVIYPGHGVAQISSIVEKNVGGVIFKFFELKFLNKDMTVLIPINNLSTVGLRRLSSSEDIDLVFKLLSEPIQRPYQEITAISWNKRNKEYQCKVRTGNIGEIGKIYRDLKYISAYKELSFGEKNLLQRTELLLVEEISVVKAVGRESAMQLLRSNVEVLETVVAHIPIKHGPQITL
jgi:CarD family transcriptional regulator